ncbi:orotidine-5'-phosphate decarboxylase [Pelagibacteraceae bacterium]|nr:orotidine-5'-phosphate decarboxylase [Pelagibacteraceae bacterium]
MNRIILALDTSNLEEAINLTKKIKNKIFTVKLGLEFFNAHGKEGIKKINKLGITNLMLDLKLKDIPETVYKAIKALDDIEFGFLTIHGQGGKAMIEKAKKAADEIKSKPKIMMVTILTALSDLDLKVIGNNNTVANQVEKLAELAREINVGVVCSGHEAKVVRKIIGPNLLIFTPGIRMMNENQNDQQRVCTPKESIQNGSDKIIMGRSLIKGDIEQNLNKVSDSLKR